MTDLRLVESTNSERESDPFLDDVFAHLGEHSNGEAEYARRSLSQREAGVQAVERGLRKARDSEKSPLVRVALVAVTVTAVAAAAALWLLPKVAPGIQGADRAGLVAESSGSVMVREASGDWSLLSANLELDAGASLRTGSESSATIRTPWGASLAVRESSVVDFPQTMAREGFPSQDGRNRVVRLVSGSLELDVPPLAADETFAVSAAGHQVIVHGTQFSVTVAEEATAPCVIVRRGVVEVKGPQGSSWLKAGQHSGCGLAQEEPENLDSEAVEVQGDSEPVAQNSASTTSRVKVHAKPPAARDSTRRADGPSALAEQNRIFQSALSLQRGGDLLGARQQLSKLLKEHPDSPLAGQARAQLAQLNSAEK